MDETDIQEMLEEFKKDTGLDVEARLRGFTGIYYGEKDLKWEAATKLFHVSNHSTLTGALEELKQLHRIRTPKSAT